MIETLQETTEGLWQLILEHREKCDCRSNEEIGVRLGLTKDETEASLVINSIHRVEFGQDMPVSTLRIFLLGFRLGRRMLQ